jgi:hypothetical protein
LDGARSSGTLAYDTGIERTIATIPEAANKQMEIPAIRNSGMRVGSLKRIRMVISFWYALPKTEARLREGATKRKLSMTLRRSRVSTVAHTPLGRRHKRANARTAFGIASIVVATKGDHEG